MMVRLMACICPPAARNALLRDHGPVRRRRQRRLELHETE